MWALKVGRASTVSPDGIGAEAIADEPVLSFSRILKARIWGGG